VFEPISLGPVEVKNRVYMPPHGVPLETPVPGLGPNTMPAAELAYYYAERAAGGAGLIFQSTLVAPFATWPGPPGSSPILAEALPSFTRVAEMVHAEGAKIMAQIWYHPGLQHLWEQGGPQAPQLSPSATQSFGMPTTRYALRKEELHYAVDAHRDAARNLRMCGYDGIELHVSHGMLLENFLSPYFNQRQDEYGGSLANRARLVVEILEAIREETAGQLALGIRFTVDQMLPGGWGENGAREILAHLTGTGLMDFVDLDIAVEPEQHHLAIPPFFERRLHNADRVARVRGAAGSVPVLATPGRVTAIAEVEDLLQRGVADLVGIARGLIAEPELVNNALLGREIESRTCIAANHCSPYNPGHGCALNPTVAKEERWGVRRNQLAPRSMRVVVVGGGPAGLEAARVAAMRGHRVTLLEREGELGGATVLLSRVPGREHIVKSREWWQRQLQRLGVEIRTGYDAERDDVLGFSPQVVIVATGARYSRDGASGFSPRAIAGSEREIVLTPEEILGGAAQPTGDVVVVDEEGRQAGVGVAEFLSAAGANVSLVTSYPAPGAHLQSQAHYVMPRLHEVGVELLPGTAVVEIGDGRVTLSDPAGGPDWVKPVDAVVLATMRVPVDGLVGALQGTVDHIYQVGDALAPRSLMEATYEGHRFARVIGEDDMPRSVIEELFKAAPGLRPAALITPPAAVAAGKEGVIA
jgi:2,4-dienoyl-CoA reductase-like NADH-dependent reductase (Old Yellow Enzyme family)/pyruvate/2-oxoglutarate dehydrogenase complex dihydrolipoamide dehydrogenase (E3) component